MPISPYTNKTKCESSFSFHLCHLWHFIRSIILILIEASDRLDGQAWVLWSLRTGFESQFCLSLVIWGSFKGLSCGCALLNLGCDENTLRIIIVKIKWDDAYKSVLVVRSIRYILVIQTRTFHAKKGIIKDRYGTDLRETEDIRRGAKNTQKNYAKKIFMTQITTMVGSLT